MRDQSPWRLCLTFCFLTASLVRTVVGDTADDIRRLEKKYRLAIVTRKAAFPVTRGVFHLDGRDPRPEEVDRAVKLLADELGLYPESFLRQLPLRRIVVCRDLTVNGKHVGGWADYLYSTLYLNGSRISSDEESVRHALHHEIFHLLDVADDREVLRDPAWEALNPPGFHYGGDAMRMLDDPTAGLLTTGHAGFLNAYSMSAVAEDKAEVYSYMVTAFPLVEQMAQNDAVIAAKVAAVKRIVRGFSPEMDDRFWRQFRVGEEAQLAALQAVRDARKAADDALAAGDLYGAFARYRSALETARRRLSGVAAVEECAALTRQIAEILAAATAPLDKAQEAIENGELSAALDELEAFATQRAQFLAISEVQNRFEMLQRHPSLRPEKRERAVRERIRAGDAALQRGDLRSAARWYRSAARVFPDSQAAQEARSKLESLLADEETAAQIERQNVNMECQALLARGRLLMKQGRPADAVAVFDRIIANFPDTPWAQEASRAKELCAAGARED